MHTAAYLHRVRKTEPEIDASLRQTTFDEVFGGLDELDAGFEARRCLSCGNCFECDNCYKVCPGDAIRKLEPGQRFTFDYDNCDACGLCVEECPCGAIEMEAGQVSTPVWK